MKGNERGGDGGSVSLTGSSTKGLEVAVFRAVLRPLVTFIQI